MDITLYFLLKVLLYAIFVITCIMLYFLERWPTPRQFWMIQKLPGPKGIFYFGNALQMMNVPLEDYITWLGCQMSKYNRMFRMWFLGEAYVYLAEAEDVKVLLSSRNHLDKGSDYKYVQDWLDEGLITSTGDKWFARRKLLTPAFHFKILEDNLPVFNKNAKILCQKLKDSKEQDVNVQSLATLCALDAIVETAMGIDIKAQTDSAQEYVQQIKSVSKFLAHRTLTPYLFKDWIFNLTPVGRQFWKTVNFLHNISYKVIQKRRENYETKHREQAEQTEFGGKVRRALLDTLLEIEHNQPGTLSDKDIREEVDTFLFAGHDTTSTALVHIFLNLAQHPDIQEKVAEEINDIFGDDDREVTTNDVHHMTYLDKFIKETMRIHPIVPYITRTIEKDLVLEDGCTIPAHSNVVIPIFYIQNNEKYWPEPDRFDPERFSEEQSRGRHPYAYIPFSAGPRNCIGQKYALMEVKVVAATVLRSLKVVQVTKVEDIKFTVHIITVPNKPIICKFVPR